MKRYLPILVTIISLVGIAAADIKLPAIIGDNMALQQNTNVNLWGWANPAERIKIETGWGEKAEFIANGEGKWKCQIKTPKAGKAYSITFKGNNTIEITNVIIGEVWLCSGQSNMSMPMSGWDKQPIHGGEEAIANSESQYIRLFTVKNVTSDIPLENTAGKWVECTPETVKDFSAVGYYFGRKVNKDTGYPVGLIRSSWGGTLAQAWTRIDYLQNDDNLVSLVDAYNKFYNEWENKCSKAKQDNTAEPKLNYPARPQDKPATLYNGMIAPITNMTIKGSIWYQGESNANAAYIYRDLFPTMIKNWRCDFNNFDMPFYFVQLASYTTHKPGQEVKPYRGEPRENGWAELREAQLMTNDLKNTGMAVAIDIGDTNNIHPGNKKDVGERLALWALAKDYGKDIECSGPLYAGYKIEGDKIRIYFKYADSGLIFKNAKPLGFAIAGKDRKFVWADAKIDGETVVVFSPKVKEPQAVRYAWDNDPEISLINKTGLPASPFRTDDWKGATFNNKW